MGQKDKKEEESIQYKKGSNTPLDGPKTSKEDLVGRPLVPFFDSNDNLNEALICDKTNHEQIEVDARVWNPEGYFEYPDQKAERESRDKRKQNTSALDSLRETEIDGAEKGKMLLQLVQGSQAITGNPGHQIISQTPLTGLLTPTALLTPSLLKQGSQVNTDDIQRTLFNDKSVSTPLQKEGEKSGKKKSGKDTKEKKQDQPSSKKNNKGKANTQPHTKSSNASDSTASLSSPKWAWSAFQSSPDPKSLPMPSLARFQSLGRTDSDASFDEPFALDTSDAEHEASLSFLPPPPPLPPLPPLLTPNEVISKPSFLTEDQIMTATPMPTTTTTTSTPVLLTSTQAMTEDLRRMLNIQ